MNLYDAYYRRQQRVTNARKWQTRAGQVVPWGHIAAYLIVAAAAIAIGIWSMF